MGSERGAAMKNGPERGARETPERAPPVTLSTIKVAVTDASFAISVFLEEV